MFHRRYRRWLQSKGLSVKKTNTNKQTKKLNIFATFGLGCSSFQKTFDQETDDINQAFRSLLYWFCIMYIFPMLYTPLSSFHIRFPVAHLLPSQSQSLYKSLFLQPERFERQGLGE